ncbi:MAG: NUDIX hydrolase [Sinobacteraceae bacterium]|nr:NUDIX hydrolase [Nevskiaceae bacterium]
MSPPPDITVAAIVVRDQRFLIVEERIAGRNVFNQPAGHVEPGETLLQAVVRETLEETAWTLRPLALLGVYRWQPPTARRPTLRFAFVGETTAHDPLRRLDQGILAAHWMTRTELVAAAGQLRSPLVLHCIDDFLAGQRRPLEPFAALDLDTAASAPALTIA